LNPNGAAARQHRVEAAISLYYSFTGRLRNAAAGFHTRILLGVYEAHHRRFSVAKARKTRRPAINAFLTLSAVTKW